MTPICKSVVAFLVGALLTPTLCFSLGCRVAPKEVTRVTTPIPDPATRPLLSRKNLPELKTVDRARVFAVLGSFDDRGLSADEFDRQALGLLDAAKVPGLAEARASGDTVKALDLVFRACRRDRSAPSRVAISPTDLALANDALENRFTFYSEPHQLPPRIDWDYNPGTAHWGHDLNRFTFLRPLTQAYLATGDTRYSRKAAGLILEWIAACDMGRCFTESPYIFGSYLNNAFHCEAWAACLDVLVPSQQITPEELLRVLKSLHDQLACLEIRTNGHSGNWPTIGCGCMLSVLAAYPVFRDTDRFADYYIRTMKAQIADQVLQDGAQYDLSPHYHRVVLDNLVSSFRSIRTLGRPFDPELVQILGKMVHYYQQAVVPDGSKQVAFNDSDAGDPGNFRSRLTALGLAYLLSPPDRLGSELFPNAGVAFLRQRQDQGDLYLALDAGPYGLDHQHEDKLGFWLFAYGRNLIVDPGRHLYDESEKSYYLYLQSTAAHSTIRIDGQGQNTLSRPDTWISRTPLDMGWRVREGEVGVSGIYDLGYGPKNDIAVKHRREIVFVKERCWVVFDAVEGEGEHQIESRFQFAPGTLVVEDGAAHTGFDDANLLLQPAPAAPFTDIHLEQGKENPRGGWYSDFYGRVEPAPALSMSLRTPLPWRSATLLFPYRGKTVPKVEFTFDGRAAQIRHRDLGDVRVECTLP